MDGWKLEDQRPPGIAVGFKPWPQNGPSKCHGDAAMVWNGQPKAEKMGQFVDIYYYVYKGKDKYVDHSWYTCMFVYMYMHIYTI